MGDKSKIEWTEATWNPVTGCTRVSAGCDNCYAVTMTKRIAATGNPAYVGLVNEGKDHFNGKVNLLPERLDQPLRWKKPRRIFVNSMSDLFHPSVPFEFVDRVFAVMGYCKRHQFQVLTKRPERAAEYFEGAEDRVHAALCEDHKTWPITRFERVSLWRMMDAWASLYGPWPLRNVWIGTSVEDQETADERIPHLLKIPASVRWLSMEPLLGPVDLHKVRTHEGDKNVLIVGAEGGIDFSYTPRQFIHWVVVGGESGPGARPMHPDWARSIRDQCIEACVPTENQRARG